MACRLVRGLTPLKVGDYVKVNWHLSTALPEEIDVFDQGACNLVVGNGYIPQLHDCLLKLKEEKESFHLKAPFGESDPRMGPVSVPASNAPKGLTAGDRVRLATGQTARVLKISDSGVVEIDANHPLAGQDLELEVELVEKFSSPLPSCHFGIGCFWGAELAFQRLPGVVATSVGYANGQTKDPSYQQVCSGSTGHTEAVEVTYDPTLVDFERICSLFWERLGENRFALNRVGNDMGTQYRHGIYYHTEEQAAIAKASFESEQAKHPDRPILTELEPLSVYYLAEDYHQQYLQKGGQSAKKEAQETIRCYG